MNAAEARRAMVDHLVAADVLHDPAWVDAVSAVPRHALVPRFLRQEPDRAWASVSADSPGFLSAVYSDTPLITAVADLGAGYPEPVSSSTGPGLMIRMLETLALREGERVLEIGTGTGYNAALLARRLGDDQTYSVDVSPELVDIAIERLAAIGSRPHVHAGDGAAGWAEHAPYDAVLATCSVNRIPTAWIEQTREGGRLLADLKLQNTAGNLVLLRRHGRRALGRFTRKYAAFMSLRHTSPPTIDPAVGPRPDSTTRQNTEAYDAAGVARERESTALIDPTTDTVAWFFAVMRMPIPITFGYTLDPDTRHPTGVQLWGADGSTSHVTMNHGGRPHYVTETGPTSLHHHIENAREQWLAWDRPGWDRLGLTVDTTSTGENGSGAGRHTLWIDDPHDAVLTLPGLAIDN